MAAAAALAEAARLDTFSLVLTDNDTIRELNRELLGADRPTDAIAFEAEVGPDGQSEAEAYISVEQAAIQAAEHGHSLHWELAFLTAHTVLHALGHSDRDAQDKQAMFDKQTAVVRRFEERIKSVQD